MANDDFNQINLLTVGAKKSIESKKTELNITNLFPLWFGFYQCLYDFTKAYILYVNEQDLVRVLAGLCKSLFGQFNLRIIIDLN